MRESIYVSGKITGLDLEEAINKFDKACMKLQDLGYSAVNPMDIKLSDNSKWEDYILIDLHLLSKCDGIYMLDNWRTSVGAVIEFQFALKLGILLLGDINNDDLKKYSI